MRAFSAASSLGRRSLRASTRPLPLQSVTCRSEFWATKAQYSLRAMSSRFCFGVDASVSISVRAPNSCPQPSGVEGQYKAANIMATPSGYCGRDATACNNLNGTDGERS